MNTVKVTTRIEQRRSRWEFLLIVPLVLVFVSGCATTQSVGQGEPRKGDEIVAAGQFFHTGTPVVLWMDPGGYDAYRVERRFSPLSKAGWTDSHEEIKALTSP